MTDCLIIWILHSLPLLLYYYLVQAKTVKMQKTDSCKILIPNYHATWRHNLADTSRFWELSKIPLPQVSYKQEMTAANLFILIKKIYIYICILGATFHMSHRHETGWPKGMVSKTYKYHTDFKLFSEIHITHTVEIETINNN
jgi:hypothetical protein